VIKSGARGPGDRRHTPGAKSRACGELVAKAEALAYLGATTKATVWGFFRSL